MGDPRAIFGLTQNRFLVSLSVQVNRARSHDSTFWCSNITSASSGLDDGRLFGALTASGKESVGGLLIDMAEDKGDVKPSNDMSRAGDNVAASSNC